jgi:hypothetical protein
MSRVSCFRRTMCSTNKLNIRPIRAFVLNNSNNYISLVKKLSHSHPKFFELSVKFPMKEFSMKMHDMNYFLPFNEKISTNQFLAIDNNNNFLNECSSVGLHTCKLDFSNDIKFRYDWMINRFSINDLSFLSRVIHDIELEQ